MNIHFLLYIQLNRCKHWRRLAVENMYITTEELMNWFYDSVPMMLLNAEGVDSSTGASW